MMPVTWILVAQASKADLYKSENIANDIELYQTFAHPESREKTGELVTDKVGHYQSNNGAGQGSFVEPSDPKVVEAEKFANELAQVLNHGRNNDAYDRLVVIAPPKFHGLLNNACNPQVQRMIGDGQHVYKDYTHLEKPDLLKVLAELPRF